MRDGTHIQFDREMGAHQAGTPPAPLPVAMMVESQGPYSYSGIVMPKGNNVQFTPEQADNIILVGPSGVVTKDGKNLQLNSNGLPSRKKRSYGAVVGPSGLITPSGRLIQLAAGVTVVS